MSDLLGRVFGQYFHGRADEGYSLQQRDGAPLNRRELYRVTKLLLEGGFQDLYSEMRMAEIHMSYLRGVANCQLSLLKWYQEGNDEHA